MPIASRCLWLGVLVSFLSGCAGNYYVVTMPQTEPNGSGAAPNFDVAAGDDLRLHLRNGAVVSGKFIQVRGGSLLLREVRAESEAQDSFAELARPDDAAAEATVAYPLAEIERVERYESDVAGTAAVVVGIAGVVFVMSKLIASATNLELFEGD